MLYNMQITSVVIALLVLQDVPDYEVSWRIIKQKPGHCASVIYTSGTTGPPKVTNYKEFY